MDSSASRAPIRLSRSKIDLFTQCPRCFFLDVKLKIKRPDTYPLTLNLAVDALLKKEFDIHRAQGNAHPLMRAYQLDAVPFNHPQINTWRELDYGRGGIHHHDTQNHFDVYGIVDDIWVTPKNELLVVDYKATAKKERPTLAGNLGDQYKRQMEVYQWLLRKNGFTVSETGYFVYVNGKKDAEAFDAKLEFDISLLPCVGSTDWIEETLSRMRSCLDEKKPPAPADACDYCNYRASAGKALQSLIQKTPPAEKSTRADMKKPSKKIRNAASNSAPIPSGTLF